MVKRTIKEKPIYGFRRRGEALVPDMDMDAKALDGIAQGELVRVEIKEFRNAKRHRLYWAMLHDILEATDSALSVHRLHEIVKLKTGLVEVVCLPDGTPIALPGSIAFDKISEPEFVAFLEKAQQFLAETFGYVAPERGTHPGPSTTSGPEGAAAGSSRLPPAQSYAKIRG